MSGIKNETVFGINLNVNEFLDNLNDEQAKESKVRELLRDYIRKYPGIFESATV